jgi:HK97 family phage prohead protease
MTDELILRAVQPDSIEFEGAEGRTLHARLFTWDTISRVQDPGRPPYDEEWMRGVFGQSIKSIQRSKKGWPMFYDHGVERRVPIGVVAMIHERNDGPWMTSKISRTQFGDEVIELIKDGAVPGVSVRGRNIKSRRTPEGVVQRMEVAVEEVSVTPFPALVGADELVLRALNGLPPYSHAHSINTQQVNDSPPQPTPAPRRDELAEYLASLKRP